MSKYPGFPTPKRNYLREPQNQSCYEYLLECNARIKEDLGDYTAFVVPVADQISETKMSKLFSDIEKLAAYFTSIGLKKGDVYTIFMPTSAHAIVAFYALNKIGVISSFIHPLTPPNALAEMLELTKSKGMLILDLTCAVFAPVMAKYRTIVCSTSDYCDGIAYKYAAYNEMQNAKVPELDTIIRYKDIMAMDLPQVETVKDMGKTDAIYLNGGGTTGKSKTIIHSSYSFNHLAYKLYLYDQEEMHEYDNDAHSMCVLPFFHAFGLGGAMHYPLCNAYKPIVISKFDPVQANELIKKLNVSEILGVPKLFEKMFYADNFDNDGLKNLKMLFAGGDTLTNTFREKFDEVIHRHGAIASLYAGYGLTEMCAVCTNNSSLGDRPGSVGAPIPGVEIEIWDPDSKRLPNGEIGEIVMSGETMMNGYLPDGNVADNGIYTDENGKKWVKTGDMGYKDDDGFIFFSGRKKRIIIIAGYNIYPATIEEYVSKLDYINEVCAVQGYDENGKPLCKLCVSLKDQNADHDEVITKLKAYCESKIEGYACPRKYEIYDLLPRTKMEKIDFMKLTEMLNPVDIAG